MGLLDQYPFPESELLTHFDRTDLSPKELLQPPSFAFKALWKGSRNNSENVLIVNSSGGPPEIFRERFNAPQSRILFFFVSGLLVI